MGSEGQLTSKDEQLIMVVSCEKLFDNGKDYFEGFRPHSEIDYESRILQNCKFIKRGDAENDPSHKQPIAYVLVVNPVLRQVFAYRRATKDLAYSEKRLQGKWSWGIGGHIEKIDSEEFNGSARNPIQSSMLREIDEEIGFEKMGKTRVLGYINFDSNNVGKVHFGILYVIETESSIIVPKTSEMETGTFKTISELEEINASRLLEVEDWSRIALGPLKNYLRFQEGQ